MKKTAKYLAALALTALSSVSLANTQTQAAPQLTAEQQNLLDTCSFVSLGLVEIAGMRQGNIAKAEAQKNLDGMIADVVKMSEDKDGAKSLGGFWKENVDGLYKVPVYEKEEEKMQFLQYVFDTSMHTCIAELGPQNTKTK